MKGFTIARNALVYFVRATTMMKKGFITIINALSYFFRASETRKMVLKY